jgi:hypothetical protein
MSKSIEDILFKIEEERKRKILEEENKLKEALERQKDEYLRRLQFPIKSIVAQNISPLSIPVTTGGRRKTIGTIISFTGGKLVETPFGPINGSNKVFILSFVPDPGSDHIYLNGLLQEFGLTEDYTLSGQILTFVEAPEPGDIITISYQVGETEPVYL